MFFFGVVASFAVGLCIGAVLFNQFKSDAAKVRALEQLLEELQAEHDAYKEDVHGHFDATAKLVNNLTNSYRDVYQHLASGAQTLCPESIAGQLTINPEASDIFLVADPENKQALSNIKEEGSIPPQDYAAKSNPDQLGNLSEEFGLAKAKASNE